MAAFLEQHHREERGARREIAQIPAAKHLHRGREWVPHQRMGSVGNAESAAYQGEERVLLASAVNRSAAIGSLVKPGPHFERCAANGHVASRADSAEAADLEPVGCVAVNDERCGAIVRIASNLRKETFRLGFDLEGNCLSADSHYSRIAKLVGEPGEPSLLGN